jgi:tRNA A-37 threonylcarbamoyl transferase component Bud32
MVIKSLSGHSGCKILLCQDRESKYVRKISPSKKYNERLVTQSTKQEIFLSKKNRIKAPEIFRKGYIEDLFYFDMEYISGNLMSDYINNSDISSINSHFEVILNYLNTFKDPEFKDLTLPILKKVNKLKSESSNRYSRYFDYVSDGSWDNLPVTFCHGDFTFENIIVSNGNIYFIDFLDAFIETSLLDVSKILFDIRYFWSKRDSRRKDIVKNVYMDNKIRETSAYSKNSEIINRLMVLDILRIIPYCREDSLISYLEECLEHATR